MRQEIDYGQYRYEGLSLLWPDMNKQSYFQMTKEEIEDLNIRPLYDYIFENSELDIFVWLDKVPNDQEVSLYRQQVMEDIYDNHNLYEVLYRFGQEAHNLMTMGKFAFEKEATVYNLLKRTQEFDRLKDMLESLLDELSKAELKSVGLIKYEELLKTIVTSPVFEAFAKDVGRIKALDEGVKSIRIGLNLNEYLQPIEAILLELSDEEFKYDRFMKKIGYYVSSGIDEIKLIPRKIFARETVPAPDALNTLEKTIEPASLQLITFCDQFTMKIMEVISVLYHELPYFNIGRLMMEKLESNHEPIIKPLWDDEEYIHDLYHVSLGIDQKEPIVKNSINLKSDNLYILTGANRGGKTTFTQSVSIILWFAQLGYYVPAKTAHLPYIDHLFLHFPREEKETLNLGRLGEECMRFRQIFDQMTSRSFLAMNESFQGTSHQESLQIALETMIANKDKSCKVLFNTHLHELVEALEMEDCQVKSLIAGKNMKESPYIIEEGRPLGKSYAYEIAKKYGMLYSQLVKQEKDKQERT